MAMANLLLVDDEQAFVEIMAQRLEKRDFFVARAFSGQEALDRLEADDAIDVVVLDVNMPGRGGIETARLIKEKHPLVEIVMLTGHAAIHSAVEAIKWGAFDYLIKPCALDELIVKVKQAANRKKDRENKILEVQMRPYISRREKDVLISDILDF